MLVIDIYSSKCCHCLYISNTVNVILLKVNYFLHACLQIMVISYVQNFGNLQLSPML